MVEKEDKKDLTSLVELSALELAKAPGLENESPIPAEVGGTDPAVAPPAPGVPESTDGAMGLNLDFSASAPAADLPTGASPNDFPSVDAIASFDAQPAPQEASEEASAPVEMTTTPDIHHSDREPGLQVDTTPEPEVELAARNPDPLPEPGAPPVNAPPAGSDHVKKQSTPKEAKQDLSEVRKFGEKIAIGKPHIEASPAFSMMAMFEPTAKTIKWITDVVASEDCGVRPEDIRVLLEPGKLLIPQISEFAAITLAQKIRDVVDNIELGLASEIFTSESSKDFTADESYFVDTEHYEQRKEEVHDLALEPKSENELFSSNLSELSGYQITRILSAVTASEIANAEVAENPTSRDFEAITEKITKELIARAFKLGAHGVIGVNFNLRPIDGYRDSQGQVRRAYRLLGTGTAVRAVKR